MHTRTLDGARAEPLSSVSMADESSGRAIAPGVWQVKLPKAAQLLARTLQKRVNAHRVDELSIGELLLMALESLRDDIDSEERPPEQLSSYEPMRMPRGPLWRRDLSSLNLMNMKRLIAVVHAAVDAGVGGESAKALLGRLNAALKANDPY